MSLLSRIQGIKSQVGISYFLLNIISISLFSWVISINQLELIADNSRYHAKELISSVVSSLHKMPLPSRPDRLSEKAQQPFLVSTSNMISRMIPDHILFNQERILIQAGSDINLPADYQEQARKALALEQNSGMEYNLALDDNRSHLNVFISLENIGLKGVTLYTRISLRNISERYRDLYKQIGMTILGLTLLHFLFGLFLFRKIVTPILTIESATEKISSGDYSTRIELQRLDEIGSLANGFNHMSATIQEAFIRMQQQMEDLKIAHGKIERMATTDELTGLYNRRQFFELLRKHVSHAMRHNRPLTIALMDIDHFKNINDHHGHIFGDKVLRETCIELTKLVRESDILARYGGEEIIILFPDSDIQNGMVAAEKIRAALEVCTYELPSGDRVAVTASFGVAEIHTALSNPNREYTDVQIAFIECADKALYQAKHAGRNRVVMYEPGVQ